MPAPIAVVLLALALPAAAPSDSLPADSTVRALADTVVARPADSTVARPRMMQDTVTTLPPIRVESNRVAPSTRSTATHEKIDHATAHRFLPTSTTDALIVVPGIDLVRTGPWATRIDYRGFSGERVLVMVDGVRLNTGRGHGALSSLVSLDRLDEIDLSPGAASAQYGSDAMGGVVNLVTHRDLVGLDRRAILSIGLRGATPGGEQSQNVRLRVTGQNLGLDISTGFARVAALTTPDGPVPNSSFREQDLTGRVGAKLGYTTLDYEYSHHAAYDVGLPAFNGAAGGSGEYPYQGRDAGRLELIMRPTGTSQEARLLASDQTFHSDFTEEDVAGLFVRGRLVGIKTTNAADQLLTRERSLAPSWQIGLGQRVRVAGEYRRENTGGPRLTTETVMNTAGQVTSATETPSESVPPAWRDVLGGSVSTSLLWRTVRLETGARYDWFHSRADSTPVSFTSKLDVVEQRPSVEGGLSWGIGRFEPYAHVGTSFRAPTLEERYYNDDFHGGLRLFGNPDLTAEHGVSYEAGLRGTGERSSFRFSAYRSDVDDFITLKYIGQLYLVPRFQYVNLQRARIEGLELTAGTRIGASGFNLYAALPQGEDLDTHERLVDVGSPRVTLEYTQRCDGIMPLGTFALRGRWTSAVPAQPSADPSAAPVARPAFWTADAEMAFSLGGARATFAIRNMFDRRYREPLSFIDEPGRTVVVRLARDFSLPTFGSRGTPTR